MEYLIEILKFTLPSLILFALCVYFVNRFMKREAWQHQQEQAIARQKMSLPLRLQACERLVLFVERINPENLIQRQLKTGMTNMALHSLLLQTIRKEFEHNLSQQVYVSDLTWNRVVLAKDELIGTFNRCASGINPQGSAMELSEIVLTTYLNLIPNPLHSARTQIRNEVRQLF